MSTAVPRQEVLELLARGKISIDEAVALLDQSSGSTDPVQRDEPLYKAEVDDGPNIERLVKVNAEDEMAAAELPAKEKEFQFDDIAYSSVKSSGSGKRPRWLRVQVANIETGRNKVSVNIPFGMVKFGLGIARVFSPEMKGVDFDEIDELISNTDAGLLVDVQDDESNEHVKIFFD